MQTLKNNTKNIYKMKLINIEINESVPVMIIQGHAYLATVKLKFKNFWGQIKREKCLSNQSRPYLYKWLYSLFYVY